MSFDFLRHLVEKYLKTRIHSSRMRTVRGSSRPRGGLPQYMLGYTPEVWAWRPPQVWAWRPPGDLLQGMLGYQPPGDRILETRY